MTDRRRRLTRPEPGTTDPDVGDETVEQLHRGGGSRELSGGGVLRLDRALPFLLVHRAPTDRVDDGTEALLAGEAAVLVARDEPPEEVSDLSAALATRGSAAHGAYLVIEVWTSPDPDCKRFTLHAPVGPAPETVGTMLEALRPLAELAPGLEVGFETADTRHPPGFPPLLSIEESWRHEILLLGLELPPIWRDPATGGLYPRFHRRVRHALSRALRRAVYHFLRVQTTLKVENHLALGTRTAPDAVWEIDEALYDLERAFDPLLLVTPVNGEEAWARFERDGYDRNPEMHYRLLPFDPDLLKRRLFAIGIEKVEDPAFADLLHDKRSELDTQITMLGDRGSARFRYHSHRLYGVVDERLRATAREILEEVPRPGRWTGEWVDAHGFRVAALREVDRFRKRLPDIDRTVEIRRDVAGLLVSEGNLLIGESLKIRSDRLEPLIQHEVGTHMLTYLNGRAQPLRQLSLGLADYDELQEGLAVLAEYLVGGLDAVRMRLLAARVLAAESVEAGATFVDTFRLLHREIGYTPRGAWDITLRVHASGGFTRDLIYLRGLVDLLEMLREGTDLDTLYVGKIARRHLPIVEELRHRGILSEPPLAPRFLDDPDARKRLAAIRAGRTLTEMTCPEPR